MYIAFFRIGLILSTAVSFATYSTESNNNRISKTEYNLSDNRPKAVTKALNRAFEINKNASPENIWYFNGSPEYCLLSLKEHRLIKHIASSDFSSKDNIYVVDVGCAIGQWGRNAMRVLLFHQIKHNSKKHFHIFSLTGGTECDEKTTHKNNVSLYQLNKFKIENVDEELLKRGFDLKNNVDLIVSRWTLRHLVDPFGTLKRMYRLLNPENGILLSNGFLFKFDDSQKIETFPLEHENILAHKKHLFRLYHLGRDTGQFSIVRTDKKELDLPLEYAGSIEEIGYGYQCASRNITIYKRDKSIRPSLGKNDWNMIEGTDFYYINNQFENLYSDLKNKNLFYEQLKPL